MSAKSKTVNYAAGATRAQVLVALRDELVNACGFTLLEDSIAGSSFFVVQNQNPAEPLSRMIMRVEGASISSVEYISFNLYADWTPGSPGSGTNKLGMLNINQTNTTSTASRYHKVDLALGGNFYIDCESSGDYFIVASDVVGTPNVYNATLTVFALCSIERSAAQGNLGVNYGHLVAGSSTTLTLNRLSALNFAAWVVPKNHAGNGAAAAVSYAVATEPGLYDAVGAMPITRTSVIGALGLPNTSSPDTYNGQGRQAVAIMVGNCEFQSVATNKSASAAYGYRGVLKGVFGFGSNQDSEFVHRSTVTISGSDYTVIVDPSAPIGQMLLVPKGS